MIIFSKLGVMGRLGNQLFQYAALRGVCLRNGYRTVIPELDNKFCHGQRCLLNEFNIKADVYNGEKIKHKHKEPSWRKLDRGFFNIKDDTNIEGYFQSIFYFDGYQNIIREELTPKDEYISRNKEFVDYLRSGGREVVSVHLRRGDNMTEPNSKRLYKPAYDIDGVYFHYFRKAKDVFRNRKVVFLLFTGGARGEEDNSYDMDWCKNIFQGREYVYSENANQIDDLTRIMLCDHNILSHVSSFGWWAAFLNRNITKITVAPEYYHPEIPTLKREMFYPKDYILL